MKEGTKNIFQNYLQKPVDGNDFIKSITKFLKYEEETLEEENIDLSHEFKIPSKLDKLEIELIKEIHGKFKSWLKLMEISELENGASSLKEKLKNTKLNGMLTFLDYLQRASSAFQIKRIEFLLNYAIEKI